MSGPTREQVIKWARESGDDVEHTLPSDIDFLERFASVAFASGQASEREACAKVADAELSIEGISQRIASTIRSRGQQ